ncbi:hypothetical protein QR680_006651 [Steinernema hermaphroditum]|uniref:Uncharacterized protein n=1 Tax=Steinernema hermaphroditum TaxID=289476 RepID=A0AA39HXK5_9BILA|nr:hypothetical protein QR680_006651 [Steinernema hermaphroditum]
MEFKLLSLGGDVERRLYEALDFIVENIYDEAPSDRCVFGFIFEHPALSTPVYISFNTRAVNTAAVILRRLMRQTQSAGQNVFDQNMKITATILDPPSGRGNNSKKPLTKADATDAIVRSEKTPGLVLIRNSDSLCLPRAIAVAMGYADGTDLSASFAKITQ